MLLVLRALIVVGLAAPLHAAKNNRSAPVKLWNGTGLRGKTVKLLLDPSVQLRAPSRSVSSIASQSLSPWTYSYSIDESRIPRSIAQAQCLTSGCQTLQGGGEDLALEAKPIYYQVLVLHRVQQNPTKSPTKKKKKYKYKLGTELVAVGCTCVRPSVLPQQ
ncbi:interleukin 17a/f3 isoform X2 [Betta splendens]|uniref:Interleukin 17a/f3 isoform X2 n=1 Tax=Betta splendens TaxID=158456 RepID=A0A6P7LSM7_BETSP|nr:interleukin 17a/f3 isoform X2 [Betta splendens]